MGMGAKYIEEHKLRAISTAERISEKVEIVQLLDRLPDQILILNRDRRVVFCNEALLEYLGEDEISRIWGRLPGEVLQCQHATKEGGCGTTDHCMVCGALKSILKAQKGGFAEEECHILTSTGASLELKLVATPYEFEEEKLVFLTINDVSGENRRRLLERIFFYDLVNTASNIQGISQLIGEASAEELPEYKQLLQDLSEDLVHDLRTQQILRAAESGELRVREEEIVLEDLLEELRQRFQRQEGFRSKPIRILGGDGNTSIVSDRRLLRRVVENMVRNALEASPENEAVRMEISHDGENSEFPVRVSVNNAGHMPRHVQLQLFQRSFSTKGPGRGIGTYSMKLLGEFYLRGQVGFMSEEGLGTTFFIDLPSSVCRTATQFRGDSG